MKVLNSMDSTLLSRTQKYNSGIGIKMVIFEVHKPLEPTIIEVVEKLSIVEGVKGLDVTLYETDRTTEMLKVAVNGERLNYEELVQAIEHLGGVVRSIDRVIAGETYPKEEIKEKED